MRKPGAVDENRPDSVVSSAGFRAAGIRKDVRMYSLKNWFLSVYSERMQERNALDHKLLKRQMTADFADLLILLLRDGLCYFLLLNKVLTGQISAGMFVILFAAISNFSNCVNEIVKYYGELKGDCRRSIVYIIFKCAVSVWKSEPEK